MKGDESGSRIRWRMHIPAAPEQVFAALDSDAGRASFWAESAVEVDGHIKFRFINGYTCTPMTESARKNGTKFTPAG